MQDKRLLRLDPSQLRLRVEREFRVRLFASEQVQIETTAVDELLSVLDTHETLDRLNGYGRSEARLEAVAVTPDFHKGAGIPIGTILKSKGVLIPQAIGNDINCGMRLHTTLLDAGALPSHLNSWETAARRMFFEGGRQIPMTALERDAILGGGLSAVFGLCPWDRLGGQWEDLVRYGWHKQLDHVERNGSLPSNTAGAYADWVGASKARSYDDQIGSIGGGNHFVEIQRVERIFDRQTAYAWGLKKGSVAIMVHSGSVGIGHIAGRAIREMVRADYPKSIPHPANGIYPLGIDSPSVPQFWDLLNNAANFAFANRMFLAASAVSSLEKLLGEFDAPLLYDSPHNLVWPSPDGGFIHRKGATPARGPEAMGGTPFCYSGEPVLVPGSMGASSFVLAGQGNGNSLDSASHGAGRALSRGMASRSGLAEFDRFLRDFRIVTPLDMRRPEVRFRKDILSRKIEDLRAEGPHAYKDIRAIIDTLEMAGIARPIAELTPIATVKG